MNGVTSGLQDLGLDAPNDSNTPDGRSKYPKILFSIISNYI